MYILTDLADKYKWTNSYDLSYAALEERAQIYLYKLTHTQKVKNNARIYTHMFSHTDIHEESMRVMCSNHTYSIKQSSMK